MATTMAEVAGEDVDKGAMLCLFVEREYPELIPEFSDFVDDFNAFLVAEMDEEEGRN